MSHICPNCGARNKDDANTCRICGSTIGSGTIGSQPTHYKSAAGFVLLAVAVFVIIFYYPIWSNNALYLFDHPQSLFRPNQATQNSPANNSSLYGNVPLRSQGNAIKTTAPSTTMNATSSSNTSPTSTSSTTSPSSSTSVSSSSSSTITSTVTSIYTTSVTSTTSSVPTTSLSTTSSTSSINSTTTSTSTSSLTTTVIPAITGVIVYSSNSMPRRGQTETVTGSFSGGLSPYFYNFTVTNSINGNVIASSFFPSPTTSNSFSFLIANSPDSLGTLNIKFIVTDNSAQPQSGSATNTIRVSS